MIRKILTAFFILCVMTSVTQAADLLDVYKDALRNDPIYKASIAQFLSSKEVYPQARAGLLPDIFITGLVERKRNFERRRDITTRRKWAGEHDYILQLTQPIFDYSLIRQFIRAGLQVKQADAFLRTAKQNLIIRTAATYFNVLEAGDNVRFAGAEKRAVFRQLDEAKQRYKVGLDAITSVYDAQASYDAAVSQELSAKNDLINSRESLRKITGTLYPKLAKIITELPLLKPNPNKVELWVQSAEKYNNELRAARFAAQAAKENISVQRAGHLPTVDLIGTYENRNPFNIGFTNTDLETGRVGVQLNLPIFQGGLILSQTRQAKYDYQKALADLDASYKNAVVGTRQFYNNVISGISVVIADRQGVISAKSSEESNQAAYRVGTRTIIDVLLAQRQLYDAQRRQASDQYSYINDILALKNAAGILNSVDLEEVNTWLNTPTAHTTMERFKKHKINPNSHYGKPVVKKPSAKARLAKQRKIKRAHARLAARTAKAKHKQVTTKNHVVQTKTASNKKVIVSSATSHKKIKEAHTTQAQQTQKQIKNKKNIHQAKTTKDNKSG